ncbi:hypothetical protein Taro_049709 [Colocasia esculenta]|uniref:Uncharacterized protein n=1 Tax=Colocasia esculenta TaxID=4460 RepID=A0A843XBV2_COLES|nr:hypothetical protein [Colocasia esculenta]
MLLVRARRTFPVRRPVLGRVVAEQGQYLQRSIVYFLLLYLGVCPRLLYTFSVLMDYGYVNCEKIIYEMWCVPLCLHGLWFGIPCEASARSREANSDQVRYRFYGLGRGVPSHMISR